MSKVVLITGCSTGIGRDLANRLTQAGYTVAATARREEDLSEISAALKIRLDVTRADTIQNAVERVFLKFSRIDVLVNNAGYAVRGALEEISDEQVQRMFDVNVFGALRVIQAVAPYMRKQGSGRIINISSIAGRVSMPINGAYSASKFSLEAMSDALRFELAPFGIQVVLVEPGAIKTNFDYTANLQTGKILLNPDSPYQSQYKQSDEFAASMRQQDQRPEIVSRVIQQIIEEPKPKARYLAGVSFMSRLVLGLRDFVWNAVVNYIFKNQTRQAK